MLKFRCQHCRQRIAVGTRHLGKLVTCPECGEPTHPLAEQIVSLQSESHSQVRMATAVAGGRPLSGARTALAREKGDECANCGQAFGRLQQRASWMGHPVCPICHARLAGEIAAVGQAVGARDSGVASRLGQPSTHSVPAAQKVAARRVPEPSSVTDSDRPALNLSNGPALSLSNGLLARGAQAAGRMALVVGMGTVAKARDMPLLPADTEGQSGLTVRGAPDSRLRIAPPSLHSRLFFALMIVTLTGVAVYGALSLLQALAGYLTAAAFILLAVLGGYLLLRISLSAGRQLLPARSGRATRPSTVQKGT